MFLESITVFGNDVLIPISRIKYVHVGYEGNHFEIKIYSDDGDWMEGYDREEDMKTRYEMIKKILKAK